MVSAFHKAGLRWGVTFAGTKSGQYDLHHFELPAAVTAKGKKKDAQ